MKTILVEGWRGINQSLALVNQFQLLELAQHPEFSVSCSDAPFPVAIWANAGNNPGFDEEDEKCLAKLSGLPDGAVDTVYRIAMPFDKPAHPAAKRVSYIVTEFGLRKFQFAMQDGVVDAFCSGRDLIVTPSNWSKMKLMEFGFPDEKIHVVPHGVSTKMYFPLDEEERIGVRGELGLGEDDFVFVNFGSLTREKGTDLLIEAFREVRALHKNARLLLKDMRGLYQGMELEKFLPHHMSLHGQMSAGVLSSILFLPPSLPFKTLRFLYGAADCYVSPYRAEGFNLPVIEAIACGTPAIVSKGGATDDFCSPETALGVKSKQIMNAERDYFDGEPVPGYHLEPEMDSLIEQMCRAIESRQKLTQEFAQARTRLCERYSWKAVTDQLAAIL